jgi:hypothetical protein
MLTERVREFGGRWSPTRQRKHRSHPGEANREPLGPWDEKQSDRQDVPPQPCDSTWTPPVSRAHGHAWEAPEQIQADLSEIRSRRRHAADWDAPRFSSASAKLCETVTHVAKPSRGSIGDNITAVVQGFTADAVVAVASGPYGDEVIRLPVSLFTARPRIGSRVAVVIPVETGSSPALEMTGLESPAPRSALDLAYEALDALLVERHTQGPDPELEQRIDAA